MLASATGTRKMLIEIASRQTALHTPWERPRNSVGNSSLDHAHCSDGAPSQLKKLKAKKKTISTVASCAPKIPMSRRADAGGNEREHGQPAAADTVYQKETADSSDQSCDPDQRAEPQRGGDGKCAHRVQHVGRGDGCDRAGQAIQEEHASGPEHAPPIRRTEQVSIGRSGALGGQLPGFHAEAAQGLLRFLDPPMRQQPARRFRQALPPEQHEESRHSRQPEHPAPRGWAEYRTERNGDQRRCHRAQNPGDLRQRAEQRAALPARSDFREVGGAGWNIHADTEADEKARDKKLRRAGNEGRGDREHDKEDQIRDEDRAPPKAVREIAEQQQSRHRAEEARRTQ